MTVSVVLEYEAVLKRDCQQFGLTEEDIDDVVDAVCSQAGLHRMYFLWRPVAADPDDDLILEAAIASRSDFIITFNSRDFADSVRFGIRCLTPSEFLTVERADMKNIQLPDDVYQRAAELAAVDHVSVDKLVAALVNEGADDWARVRARAERGSLEKLKRVLSKVSDASSEAADRL